MNSGPLFSVIVPTYDRPTLLAEALHSIAAQSEGNFECLIVDDAGPNPARVPDDLKQDPRFRLIRLPENQGVAAARNVGLDQAQGRFLTFLDDDDLFVANRLNWARDAHDRAAVVVGGATWKGSDSPGIDRDLEGDVRHCILAGMTPPLGATSVLRTLAPRFDTNYEACQDVEWWLRLAHRARVTSLHRVVYLVRRHHGPRHRNGLAARVRGTLRLIEHHRAFFAAAPEARAFRLLRASIGAKKLGDRALARRLAAGAFTARPGLRPLAHGLRALGPSSDRIGGISPEGVESQVPAIELPLHAEDARHWTKHESGGVESRLVARRRLDRLVIAVAHCFRNPLRGYALAAGFRLLRRSRIVLDTAWATFVSSPRDHTLLHPYFDEPLETAIVARCLGEGGRVLDVGANRGWFTHLAAALGGPGGRVLAFEPDDRPRRQLEVSLAGNPALAERVTVRPVAVAEEPGKGRFQVEAQSALSHLSRAGDSGGGRPVDLTTVDLEVENGGDGPVRLIKIDVEGAEAGVLRGARKTLERHRPVVLMEAETDYLERFGDTVDDLVGALPGGYRVFWVSWEAGGLTPFRDGPPASGRNLLALPEGHPALERLPVVS